MFVKENRDRKKKKGYVRHIWEVSLVIDTINGQVHLKINDSIVNMRSCDLPNILDFPVNKDSNYQFGVQDHQKAPVKFRLI